MKKWVALTLAGKTGPKVGASRHDVIGEGATDDEAREDAIRKFAAWYGIAPNRIWFFGAWPA